MGAETDLSISLRFKMFLGAHQGSPLSVPRLCLSQAGGPGTPACSGPRLAEGSLVTGTILGATDNRNERQKPVGLVSASATEGRGQLVQMPRERTQRGRAGGGPCKAGRDRGRE